jgi:hypothetical protein
MVNQRVASEQASEARRRDLDATWTQPLHPKSTSEAIAVLDIAALLRFEGEI